MMADTGLLGLVVYLVLQIASLMAAWGIQDHRTRRFIVTSIVGYIVIGFFDRRTINSGNPYGLFYLLCCSVALVDWSLRRSLRAPFRRGAEPDLVTDPQLAAGQPTAQS
jgi:hypothetical protein